MGISYRTSRVSRCVVCDGPTPPSSAGGWRYTCSRECLSALKSAAARDQWQDGILERHAMHRRRRVCPRGHALRGDNVLWENGGTVRRCKKCRHLYCKLRMRRIRAEGRP